MIWGKTVSDNISNRMIGHDILIFTRRLLMSKFLEDALYVSQNSVHVKIDRFAIERFVEDHSGQFKHWLDESPFRIKI